MIQAEIKDTTGNIIQDVFIPQVAKEIKYSTYLEFDIKSTNILQWMNQQIQEEKEYQLQYVNKVCEVVGSVLDINPDIMRNLKYKDQEWIWDAWYMMHSIIRDFIPQPNAGEFTVTCNGEQIKYKIPDINKSLIRNEVYLDDMTFQQINEISYIEKRLADVLRALDEREKKELEYKKIDDQIQVIYSYTIMKMAVCLANVNEMPVDATFDKWLDQETIKLQDISMTDALNTIFFLLNLPKDYGTMIELSGILKRFQLGDYIKKMEKITAKELHTYKA